MSFKARELECADEGNETVEAADLLEKKLFVDGALFTLSKTAHQFFPRCGKFSCLQKILVQFGSNKAINENCTFKVDQKCTTIEPPSTRKTAKYPFSSGIF